MPSIWRRSLSNLSPETVSRFGLAWESDWPFWSVMAAGACETEGKEIGGVDYPTALWRLGFSLAKSAAMEQLAKSGS